MRQSALAVVMLFSFSAHAGEMAFLEYRYTGYGAADSARDGAVMERSNDAFIVLTSPDQPASATPQEVVDMRAYLEKPHSGHAQELKAELYRKKLAQYDNVQQPPRLTPWPTKKEIETVVTLVDTLPAGVSVKDGNVIADAPAQLLGHFNLVTKFPEKDEDLLKRVKALAFGAGGNIAVINYRREPGDSQGTCHGVTGVIVKLPTFDPTKLKLGKLPVGL